MVLFALVLAVPAIRWRAQAVLMQATGQIPDVEWRELFILLTPGVGQKEIARLLITRNPYAVIHIPNSTPAFAAAGGRLFREQCASCHAPDGSGGPGAPALFGREFKHGDSEWAIYRTIRLGVPNTSMPSHKNLKWSQLWQLVAFIRSIDVPGGELQQSAETGARLRQVRVPYDELVSTVESGNDWLAYSGSYSSTRHSSLAAINSRNVHELAIRWINQLDTPGKVESSPVVRDGIMFLTVPPARVMALDAATGHVLWVHQHPYERKGGGEGPIGQNRGVAVLNDRVFVGTWDAKLTALSATTGEVLWETTVDDRYPRSYISAAPLVFRDLVVTGVGTAPSESRGFITAYDVRTGRQRWRFMAIPGPGEHGNETWRGDSWQRGGAGTWMTGSYDPQTDMLYWGIGNPKPDFDTSSRKGDNLYSDSVVALRGTTGQLLWHFQFTPGDEHDWDSNQVPIIADRKTDQGIEKRLLWANRNGFYYVLNRETGAFVSGVPYARQTWAEGLDAKGRPIRAAADRRLTQGYPVFPGAKGATNWWPPSFDPQLDLVFIPVLEQGMVFFPTAMTLPTTSGRSFYTAVRAVDASTGKLAWEHRQDTRLVNNETGGLLSTRGGIVFGSDQSRFFALDSRSGRLLWTVETGGEIIAAPVTYAVGGQQFVTIAAGRSLLTFALPEPPAGANAAPSPLTH
jgi:alcohol dehydrogenase (cytochrome c)